MEHTHIIESFDKGYIKETLYLLHAAVNRKEGHNENLYHRLKESIKILDELKLQIQKVY